MTWTNDKPTSPGWYWLRASKRGWRDCIMWVDEQDGELYIDVGDCDSEPIIEIDGQWSGPIALPEDA